MGKDRQWSQGWLQTIISLVAGFGLSQFATWYASERTAASAYTRTLKAVQQELRFDFANAVVMTQLIKADVEVSPKNMDVLQPLPILSTSAMDAAFLNGDLEYGDPNLSLRIGEISSGMKIINEAVSNLQTYKLTNGAMNNYKDRKPLIEVMISEMLEAQINAWLETYKRVVSLGR